MLKVLGLMFISLVLASITTYLNFTYGNNYLAFFINEQIINAMLTVLGFNAASITFLISQIAAIEISQNISFLKSKSEIFHNFLWMLILFAIQFMLIVSFKFDKDTYTQEIIGIYNFGYIVTIVSIFFMFLYLFYEILSWVIHISKVNNSKKV